LKALSSAWKPKRTSINKFERKLRSVRIQPWL
jgi:hypothetical protein